MPKPANLENTLAMIQVLDDINNRHILLRTLLELASDADQTAIIVTRERDNSWLPSHIYNTGDCNLGQTIEGDLRRRYEPLGVTSAAIRDAVYELAALQRSSCFLCHHKCGAREQ